jgi:hypothetical protein
MSWVTDAPSPLLRQLGSIIGRSIGVYALFLLPSFIWVLHGLDPAGFETRHTIQAFITTWQASYWHFPDISPKISRIILDVLEAGAVAALAILFYQGFRVLEAGLPNRLRPNRTLLAEAEPAESHPSHPASVPQATGELSTQNDEKAIVRLVFIGLFMASVLLIGVIPFHSSDLYGYLNRGFQQSVLHTNPYTTPVAAIPQWEQWSFLQNHWIYNPCPYGFFFAQLAKGLTSWVGSHFFGAVLLFKTFNVLLVAGTAWLLYQLVERFGVRRPALALYLFALNPLVLLHAVGNGHNDILMIFLLMVSLWATTSQRARVWTWPLLLLSVLTKYASLLFGPFLLVLFIKKRWWPSLLIGLVLSLALLMILGAPYVQLGHPWPWRDLLDNAGKSQHSIIDMLATIVGLGAGFLDGGKHGLFSETVWKQTISGLKPLFLTGFAGFYLFWWWRFCQKPPKDGLLVALLQPAVTTMLVLVALAGAKFHPWYVIMFLPLALLLEEQSRIRRFSLLFGFIQLAGFTVLQNLAVINVLLLTLLPAVLVFYNRDAFKAPNPLTQRTEHGIHLLRS